MEHLRRSGTTTRVIPRLVQEDVIEQVLSSCFTVFNLCQKTARTENSTFLAAFRACKKFYSSPFVRTTPEPFCDGLPTHMGLWKWLIV